MLTATIKSKDGKNTLLVLKSERRTAMRGLAIVCLENGIPCTVTAEVKPREVKFKGL